MSALFVKQLTTIDFSFLCPDRGLVGETWLVDVILAGDLNDEGMVFDFSHVKKQIKVYTDSYADHCLLVPEHNQYISVHQDSAITSVTMITPKQGTITCTAPQQAIRSLPLDKITPELVQPLLEQHILSGLPDNVSRIELKLYPEEIHTPYYHYSHGLKKHSGDCQRIAHGHRSPIHIELDGLRTTSLEQQWSDLWRDIYIATREDLKDTKLLEGREHNIFKYTSNQGDFELMIAADRCYLMDTDTTVELMAHHIAEIFSKQYPQHKIRIVAFEGFKKGAIAESI